MQVKTLITGNINYSQSNDPCQVYAQHLYKFIALTLMIWFAHICPLFICNYYALCRN